LAAPRRRAIRLIPALYFLRPATPRRARPSHNRLRVQRTNHGGPFIFRAYVCVTTGRTDRPPRGGSIVRGMSGRGFCRLFAPTTNTPTDVNQRLLPGGMARPVPAPTRFDKPSRTPACALHVRTGRRVEQTLAAFAPTRRISRFTGPGRGRKRKKKTSSTCGVLHSTGDYRAKISRWSIITLIKSAWVGWPSSNQARHLGFPTFQPQVHNQNGGRNSE